MKISNIDDKKIQLSRQTFNNIDDNQFFFNIKKTIINDIKFQYSFPFNELTSLRLTPNLRYDQVITLSSSDKSLAEPNQNHFLGEDYSSLFMMLLGL